MTTMQAGTTEQGYDYDIHGLITNPGKFERAPRYVPYFYDAWLDGMADREGGDCQSTGAWAKFRLNDNDKAKFPELKRRQWVTLREDSQGFVTED